MTKIFKTQMFLLIVCCNLATGQVSYLDSLLPYINMSISQGKGSSNEYGTRAYIHALNQNYEDALKDINEAIELGSKAPNDTFYLFRAELYQLLGKHQKVYEDCETALELDYSTSNIYDVMELMFLVGDPDNCIKYANEYIEYGGEYPEAYYYRATSALVKGELDTTVYSDLRRAVNLQRRSTNPNKLNAYSYFQIGRFFYKKRNWDSALVNYNYVFTNYDSLIDQFDLKYAIGECYFFSQRYNEAITFFADVDPTSEYFSNSQYFIGRSHEYLGRYYEALEYYTFIIESNDQENDPFATLHRGVCEYELGNTERALKDLKRAKRKWYKDEPLVYLYMGKCYFRQGLNEKACKYFKTGLDKVGTDDAEIKEELRDLSRVNQCE